MTVWSTQTQAVQQTNVILKKDYEEYRLLIEMDRMKAMQ